MALEKTWQLDLNRAPSDNTTVLGLSRSWLWWQKAFLKGEIGGATAGLWTCVGSSDSVTAGMDGVDRWGATFDPTKLVRASGAVAHSWIVLKSPNFTAGGITATPFYMTVQYNGTLDNQAIYVFSKAAPTGGSITARPTATDEWVHSPTQGQVNDNTTGAMRFNGWLATDGNFAFAGIKAGQTNEPFVTQIFHVLSNADASDLYPATSLMLYTTSGFVTAGNSNWAGRSATGAATFVAGMLAYPRGQTDPSAAGQIATTGDATTGAYWDMQTFLYVSTTGQVSYRGRFADLIVAVPAIQGPSGNQGFVKPATGAPTGQILGSLWWPLNGVAVTL